MDDNTVHIGTDEKATAWWHLFVKPLVWAPVLVIVLVIVGGVIVNHTNERNHQKAANEADKKALQSSLQTAMTSSNPNGIITLVNRLLDGQKKGTYILSNSDLGKLYLDRASAYSNLKRYKDAVPDYQQAAKLDSASKLPALQGEAEARYKLDARKELIPIYQELIKLEEKSENPMRGSDIAQYQANIQALQDGQELPL